MAQEILNNVLNLKISPEELIKWLTTDIQQKLNWVDINENSIRAEFVASFLNFLRDEFTSTQQAGNIVKQTPCKKTLAHTTADGVIITEPHKIDNFEQKDTSANDQEYAKNMPEINNSCKGLVSGKEVLEVQNNEAGQFVNDAVFATSTVKTSTPEIKKRVSLQNVPITSVTLNEANLNFSKSSDAKLNFSEPRQQRESNLSLNVELSDSVKSFNITSPNNRDVDIVLTDSNRTLPPFNNSFASRTKDQSSVFNVSFLSQNCNQSECTESSSQMSGCSLKSNLQLSNSPLLLNRSQTPTSPLYSQSMMETPENSPKLQNKSSERQARKNSYFRHSTPEQTTNSSQKSVKSSSRQNFSLADFITIDTRASKKNGKKSNQKIQLLRHNKEEEAVPKPTPFLTEESFPEVGQSFEKRRRIKPTKLNISDNKGNKENTVFGVVNRPVTTNPQFSEVQSTDQSYDKISFDTERDLLRLERQKKPEGEADTKFGECDVPIKILRTPRKTVLSKSIVVPSLAMVDRIEILDTLVYLYSAFIDNNLISNPMTELHFIVSLITAQYLLSSSGKCIIKDLNPNSNFNKLEKLEDLEKDLGCAVLSREANKENDFLVQSAENSKLLLDKTGENLKELSLDDKSKFVPKILDGEDTSSNSKTSFKIDDVPLGTPHNSVYFSTRVLNEQRGLLKSLDRVTLKLLSENVHIASFQPDLRDYLVKLYHLKLSELNRTNKQYNLSIADPNVCFQIDTDNRENFPSAIAFQCFRKQRDMFYEILKIWEESHTKSNWNFSIALSGKIKSMLTLHSDVTNHCHIARLFKSQLLISCIHTGPQEECLDDESLGILKSLKGFNPEKLTQLKERLVTPLSSKGPVPEPSFPGAEEFYKNFILYAFNPMFYAHLEDCLIHEIMELNDAQFTGSDIEDTETMVDERTKQNFITCLSGLRLLAKFTGFLVSLPYRSTTSTLEDVINTQVALRRRFVPSMNLKSCLEEALINGKLSLTIPWMVEYLSQMDIASLRLPYYTQLLEILYCIYRISNSDSLVNSKQFMSPQTTVLIKFSLGWLFELPNFPINLYFTWQSSHTSKKLNSICQLENQKMEVSVVSDKRNLSLDKLDIIDDNVLYLCCPFLTEFKVLLTTGNSTTTNRHITPVSSHLPNTVGSTNIKNLEFQLEEAFFHGHPASTRKTVEFVSERVASTCVKYICNSLLPSAREKSLNELRKVIEEKYSKNFEDDPNSLKTLMMKDMNALAVDLSKQVKEQCEEVIPSMCKKRASQSIDSLLAEDTLLSVKQTCIQIAIRMATDRIRQWIQSHIVGGSLFMREMESEINRLVKSDSFSRSTGDDNHNPDGACPTDVLDDLRAFLWDLLENKGKSFTLESVSKILDQLCSCFTERADLLHGPENCLRALSVDLAIFLVAYRMDFFTFEIQSKLVKFWKISFKKIPQSESPLSRLLSPRNIRILDESYHDEAWIKCGEFIKLLLKEEVLSLESLSDQSVTLLRQDWATETMQNLSKCLTVGIVDYQATDEQMERIRCLLRWIAETYYNIDNLDE